MTPTFLKKPIHSLSLSEELKTFMLKNEFENIEQMIALGTPKLQRMPKFTVHCFMEVLDILEAHQCMHLLKEEEE